MLNKSLPRPAKTTYGMCETNDITAL